MKTQQFIELYNDYFKQNINQVDDIVMHPFTGEELIEFVSAVLEFQRKEPRYNVEKYKAPFDFRNGGTIVDSTLKVVATFNDINTTTYVCDFLNHYKN